MPATETRPNTVTITDVGPSRKKLQIEIPADAVAGKLRESLETLQVEAVLPGFRKGRVPMELIRKRFGNDVKQEAKNALVSSAYAAAIEEHKLQVVGDPFSQSLPTVQVEDGKPLSFEVEVEVMPQFDLPNLDNLEIKKPMLQVTDEMVTKELDRMCLMEGSLEERQDPEAGDYLTGLGVMTGPDGKEFYNINGAVVQIPADEKNGQGMILGVMVDDLRAQLGLPKAGQTATIKTTGPANHEVEAVRGTPLTISFKVQRVDRIIPAKPEALAANYGMESASQLKDAVRSRMEQRIQAQQLGVMRQQVAKHLVENTKMDLPERLTAQQAGRFLERTRMEMMYRGADAHQIEEQLARLRGGSISAAVRDLKLLFVLNKIAEQNKVGVEEGEINAYIARMAFERNERPEKLRQQLIQSNQVMPIWQTIREHKTLDTLIARAKVSEISAADWEKEVQRLNQGA